MGYSPWGRKESDTTEVTERACKAALRTPCLVKSLGSLGNMEIRV